MDSVGILIFSHRFHRSAQMVRVRRSSPESTDFAEVRLRGTAVIIKNPEGLTLLNMFL